MTNKQLGDKIDALSLKLDKATGNGDAGPMTLQEYASARDEAPSWLFKEDGSLINLLPIASMPTDQGQLHFLCPSGIGDFAWIYAKLWSVAEKRDVTFWFPNDEYKRVRPYCNLLGLKCEFCTIDMKECIDSPCNYEEEDWKDGGIFYLHANTHVESGERLENFLPWLPIKNPAPDRVTRWQGDKVSENYIVLHMGHHGYGEGNWPPRLWAKAVKTIQEHFNLPVMPIGAFWDKKFMEDVLLHVDVKKLPCMDQNFEYALKTIVRSKGFIGVDSGLAIMSKYLGVPTLQAYPSWLVNPTPTKRNPKGTHMPGAWELDAHPLSTWCLMDEILDKDEEKGYFKWLERMLDTK